MINKNENIRTMEYIELDFWDRPIYKCLENGYLWKDVNLGKGEPNLYSCGNEFDGEPDSPIKKELEVVFKSKYKENPYKFNYMMLSRLKSDCEYYLGYGYRNKKQLWAGNEADQIEEMKKLYNSFPDGEKPEWLTWEEILNYEKQMTSKNKTGVI